MEGHGRQHFVAEHSQDARVGRNHLGVAFASANKERRGGSLRFNLYVRIQKKTTLKFIFFFFKESAAERVAKTTLADRFTSRKVTDRSGTNQVSAEMQEEE